MRIDVGSDLLVSVGLGILGLGGLGLLLNERNRVTSLEQKLKTAEDGLSKRLNVNVPDDILKSAIDLAVNREVKTAADRARTDVVNGMKEEIKKGVNKTVNLSYNNVEAEVKSELRRKIGNLDVSKIREEIVDKAKDAVADKFDDILDNTKDKFDDKLEDVLDEVVDKFHDDVAEKIADELFNPWKERRRYRYL